MMDVVHHKPGAPVADAALASCAALHMTCLPSSLLSYAGEDFTRRFYRNVAASPTDALFYIRDKEGVVVASLVLSEDSDALTRRIPKLPLLAAALVRPRSWWPLFRAVADRSNTGNPVEPTIILLFTHAGFRRRGLSRQLVKAAENFVAERGLSRIAVVTENRPDNAAIPFYLAMGYRQLGHVRRQGQDLLRLGHDLRPAKQASRHMQNDAESGNANEG
jgi:GNAT superfamily N-acetyltransferase